MFEFVKSVYHFLLVLFWSFYFRYPAKKLTIVGVTGTDGKTTTTMLLYEIVKAAGYKASMITSVNAVIAGKTYDTGFHVTTPDAYWVQKYLREAVNHGDTHMILEVTSHGIAQHRIWGIPFAVGIITNVTHEHLDWHKTYDRYLKTKLQLLTRSKTVVINKDEPIVYEAAMKILGKDYKLITYGLGPQAMINPSSYTIETTLPGEFNRYNCLAALAGAIGLDIDEHIALDAISKFRGVAGRMEVVVDKPFTVIVDFAHTPNAIEKALATARVMTKKKLIHVFGSAGLRDHTKRPLMGESSGKFADIIVLTEEDYRTENVKTIMTEIQQGIPKRKKTYLYKNREDAIRFALTTARVGDVVIITGKGHERSLCRGTVEYPWRDQEAVQTILKEQQHP